jgi:7-cyano-7-deazaguanine synthase in queuosine biosynthesis
MSLRFARILLFFAALWLPVQTIAAIAMPLCRHAQEQGAAAVATEQAESHHCHEAPATDPVKHDARCDNCEICHLACAGFMPSAPLTTSPMPVATRYELPAIVAPPSHIGEPPQHPPRNVA